MTTPRLLSERYELGDTLGYGGMSEVHKGRDVRLSRDVAVKVLRADLARDPQFQMRFRREAQNAAALNHPAIVAVYDTGEVESEFGPLPYIVMEFVDGQTLREIVKSSGPLSQQRVIEVMADVCAALDFSHRHGIIHRDVKPANVMITKGGAVKVMDFGIARALADGQNMTQTAAVIGTAQYLSPEQARGEAVDARSDVYAAGCVLFELLTGEPPFSGDSPVAVAYQHVREDVRRPSEVNRDVPPELDAIVLKAMSKNPANRYQSAAEMRSDLVRVLRGQRPLAPAVMTEEERTALLHGGVSASGATRRINSPTGATRHAAPPNWEAEDPGRRSSAKVIGIGVGVVAMLGIIVFVATRIFGGVTGPPKLQIPVVAQQSQAQARAILTNAGFSPSIKEVPSTTPAGLAINTDPPVGTELAKGSPVTLLISAGAQPVAVPDLSSLSPVDARDKLSALGLTLAAPQQQQDTFQPNQDGKIIKQEPAKETTAKYGSTVRIWVGHYIQGTPVPQVNGMAVEDAEALLSASGLQATTQVSTSPGPVNHVVGTNPQVGSPIRPGGTVTLYVGQGNVMPNVTGKSLDEARAALSKAGYQGDITTNNTTVGDPRQDGTVISQSPTASQPLDQDGRVELWVGRYKGDDNNDNNNDNNGDNNDNGRNRNRHNNGNNSNNNDNNSFPNNFGFGN
jgi:serine/threonine-protein kinase